ncbi:MAG: alpha/beta hydrolase [Candidatus Hydrogenedentes bacterium]|nr:alpha/beta hydrolase [Candidatus Hydrogenedentota bacterium]
MYKFLRGVLYAFLTLLLLSAAVAVYLLYLDGRAPAPRPDLVRLPADAPEPPRGFPTMNMGYLYFGLGWLDLIDHKGNIPIPEGVVEEKDIEYGRVGDRALQLDLYYPKGLTEPATTLLFIHGGGWSSGDRSDYKYYTVRFAQKGYVVATAGYRMKGEAPFPAAVQDIKCAVRWLHANADKYHIDPDRIVPIGGSAGGHLAMMAGYADDVPTLAPQCGLDGVSSKVAAVVDLYGPSDLTVPDARDNATVTTFIKKSYADAPDLYALASPLKHLDKNDPPTLIVQGTIDNIVPPAQSDLLAERLQELGIPYWYDRIEGMPHTLDIIRANNERVQWLIEHFLEEFVNKPRGVAPVTQPASAESAPAG